MSIRIARLIILLTGTVLGSLACTPQRTDSGQAMIEMRGSLPCFSAEKRSDTEGRSLSLRYLQVVDAKGSQVWEARFVDGTAISPGDCIPYGRHIPGMAGGTPATPLMAGQSYRVVIMAPAAGTSRAPQGYTANFCMTRSGVATTTCSK